MTTTTPNIAMPAAGTSAPRKLRLGALTALVIGSMIGSGVFGLPHDMANAAGPLAILIGWGITAIGMLALVFVYQSLSMRKPELDAGPYAYAQAGFGPFIGFNAAWGYWLSAWIGNVSYAVLVFSALSYFVPMFGDGNTWQAVLGASVLLWAVHFLILSGVRQAALVNVITTIAVAVGMVFLVIPGLIAAVLLGFAPFLVLEQNMAPMDAVKRSVDLTKPLMGKLIVFAIVAATVNFIGAIPACLGLLATVPMTMIGWAMIYRQVAAPAGRRRKGTGPVVRKTAEFAEEG